MRTEIKELHQRLKTTTVYVTHDQIEAMTMADRIVVMHDGMVEQIGAPLELYDRPANLFVAGFIGSPAMNFLQGHASRSGGALRRPTAACTLPRRRRAGGARTASRSIYGIRPEHFTLADATASRPRSSWSSRPAPRRRSSAAHGGAGDDRRCSASATTSRPASTIHLLPDPQRAHLFDAASGKRL